MEFTISETFSYFGRLLHMTRDQVDISLIILPWPPITFRLRADKRSFSNFSTFQKMIARYEEHKHQPVDVGCRCGLWAEVSKDDFHWRWLWSTNHQSSYWMNRLWVTISWIWVVIVDKNHDSQWFDDWCADVWYTVCALGWSWSTGAPTGVGTHSGGGSYIFITKTTI